MINSDSKVSLVVISFNWIYKSIIFIFWRKSMAKKKGGKKGCGSKGK